MTARVACWCHELENMTEYDFTWTTRLLRLFHDELSTKDCWCYLKIKPVEHGRLARFDLNSFQNADLSQFVAFRLQDFPECTFDDSFDSDLNEGRVTVRIGDKEVFSSSYSREVGTFSLVITPKVNVAIDISAPSNTKVNLVLLFELRSTKRSISTSLQDWKSCLHEYVTAFVPIYLVNPDNENECALVSYGSIENSGNPHDLMITNWKTGLPDPNCNALPMPSDCFLPFTIHDKMTFFIAGDEIRPPLTDTEKAVYESFFSPLTPMGLLALHSLRSFIRNCNKKDSDIYSPVTSVAQSSGTGKSRLAMELLKSTPGIYFVFRESEKSGYPNMNDWSDCLKRNIFSAKKDDVKFENDKVEFLQFCRTNVGQFLLFLEALIAQYVGIMIEVVKNKNAMQKLRLLNEISTKQVSCDSNIFSGLKYVSNRRFETMGSLTNAIEKNIDDLYDKGGFDKQDPFLIIFDEVSILEPGAGRLNGFHILRRALHCLSSSCNLLAVAIGTNSNIIEFHEKASSDSLRYAKKNKFLPPFILGYNSNVLWDCVSNQAETKFDMSKIQVDQGLLLNRRHNALLASFGRPLWSSLHCSEITTVAKLKLQNGHLTSGESVLAIWAIRAGIHIVPSHKVARTMVKSILAKCFHASRDGNELLIGYPSDPVLAHAARELTHSKVMLPKLFSELRNFFCNGAVDCGSFGEKIVAMAVLLAIDKAESVKLSEDSDVQGLGDLNQPRSYIFETEKNSSARAPDAKDAKSPGDKPLVKSLFDTGLSKACTVENFLRKLYCKNVVDNLIASNKVSPELLQGIVNASHFVPIQRGFCWEDVDANETELPQNMKSKQYVANEVDHDLLRWAIMRQAGLIMPSRYYGVDLVIPVCLKSGVLTYISIQVKTGSSCFKRAAFESYLAKMLPGRHYVPCPIHRMSDNCCARCRDGESVSSIVCANHLALVVCIGYEPDSEVPLEGFDANDHLGENVFAVKVEHNLTDTDGKAVSRKCLKVNAMCGVGSFGIKALKVFEDDNTVQAVVRELLSGSRSIFKCLEEEDRKSLGDKMMYEDGLYLNANVNIRRSRQWSPVTERSKAGSSAGNDVVPTAGNEISVLSKLKGPMNVIETSPPEDLCISGGNSASTSSFNAYGSIAYTSPSSMLSTFQNTEISNIPSYPYSKGLGFPESTSRKRELDAVEGTAHAAPAKHSKLVSSSFDILSYNHETSVLVGEQLESGSFAAVDIWHSPVQEEEEDDE